MSDKATNRLGIVSFCIAFLVLSSLAGVIYKRKIDDINEHDRRAREYNRCLDNIHSSTPSTTTQPRSNESHYPSHESQDDIQQKAIQDLRRIQRGDLTQEEKQVVDEMKVWMREKNR